MVLMQCLIVIEQSRLITTIGTAAVPVIQGVLPLSFSIFTRQRPFSRPLFMGFNSSFVSFPTTFLIYFVSAFSIRLVFGIPKSLWIISVLFSSMLFEFFCGSTFLISKFSQWGISIILRLFPRALFTLICHIFPLRIKILKSREIDIMATGTDSERVGDIQHSVSLSLYHILVLASGVIRRCFGLQSLASNQIIPQAKGLSYGG